MAAYHLAVRIRERDVNVGTILADRAHHRVRRRCASQSAQLHPGQPADWREHVRPFFVLHHLGLIDQGFGDAETWAEFAAVLDRYAGA